jgi:SPOR domain
MARMDKNRGEGSEPEEFEPFAAAADNDRDDYLQAAPLETDRLDLDDEDERLPWLDADDDFDGEESDSGRVLGLVIMGLIALATIVGGIWWATHRTPDEALVADGSTIAAPATPYKQAPKDPGGKTFDGTGNTAFAVSEGQTRPAKLGAPSPAVASQAPDAAAVKPGFDSVKPAVPSATARTAVTAKPATAAPAPAPAGGPVVQVGAYSTRASAEAAWSRLAQQHSALSGVRHQTVEGRADIGTVFRLQALPGDAAAAQALCGRLKASGLACQVK